MDLTGQSQNAQSELCKSGSVNSTPVPLSAGVLGDGDRRQSPTSASPSSLFNQLAAIRSVLQGKTKPCLESLQGKKTYATCVVALVLLFGSWQGWWKVPSEVGQGLTVLALAFLRAGQTSFGIKQQKIKDTTS